MAFPTGWQWRCAVTILGSAVGGGGVTDFSALLRIETSKLTAARGDLGDVRWSLDSSGAAQLAADLLYTWGSHAYWRVRIPTILSATNTTVYAWWGKSDATLPAAGDTFGRYAAYDDDWRMYLPGDSLTDRVDDIACTVVNTNASAGNSGGTSGQVFSFSGGHIRVEDESVGQATGPYMFMANVYQNSAELARICDVASRWWIFTETFPRNLVGEESGKGTTLNGQLTSVWTSIAYGRSATQAILFRNGSTQVSARSGHLASTTAKLTIGDIFSGIRPFGGQMAHVSMHNNQRSTGWCTTEMYQVNSPGSFSSTGTPEDVSPPPTTIYQRRRPGVSRVGSRSVA